MHVNGKFKPTSTQIIVFSFFAIIMIGAILLSLPIASKNGAFTPFADSLFTATSATCVTGLVIYDTYTHWSLFGQLVILCMIQLGGLGFMTTITMLFIFMKRTISLHERRILMQSAGTMRLSGIVRLIRKIFIGTLSFEGVGALVLFTQFYPEMGLLKGMYYAMFHSISAFCNAGFDLMGYREPFSSFTSYRSNPVVCLTLAALIVLGGIGFLVWNDCTRCGIHFKKYELHTKMVLTTTFFLITFGFLLFFMFEKNDSMAAFSLKDRIVASIFQAVTPRTAGYNTIAMSRLSESGHLLTVLLMFVGGSPGSTAGGIKTTTFLVLILSAIASARGGGITLFKRRLSDATVKQAGAISAIYMVACIGSTLALCALEPYTMEDILFEVVSAAGTVGLSVGITPFLGAASHFILIILMFGGRVGILSLVLLLAQAKAQVPMERPMEKILVG